MPGDGGESPHAAMAAQAAARRAETRALLGRVVWRRPFTAAALWRWIGWTQRAVAYRERARLKQALLYSRCRSIALAIGHRLIEAGRLTDPNDVFMLTWPEIDALGSGFAMFPDATIDLVRLRRGEHARLSAMTPPDTLRLPEGEYLSLETAALSDAAPSESQTPRDGALSGACACGGQVTGRAAVLRDVSAAHLLARGDVLVTRQTDPGWGPVFCLVSGLVIERGGMLSHGAILAREFGLPCVVGVADATRRIAHGRRITVDGDRGVCHLHADEAGPP